MNNYICTGKGFVKDAGFSQEAQEFVIEYCDKVRNAKTFNTKAALKFMENHEIEGFVWKPYEQEAIRNMYVVRKTNHYGFGEDREHEMVEAWIPEKAMMESESDIAFLTLKKLKAVDMMTFEEARAEALRLNMEMMTELNDKIKNLSHATE